jgi:hypothetical protein
MLVDGKFGGTFWIVRDWFFGGWEKSLLAWPDTDAVTPAGAAIPSWRASGSPLPHSLPCIERNLRIRPGNSVVIVAFLSEGVA